MTDINEELERVRTQRKELAAARATRNAQTDLARELEKETQALADDQALVDAEEKYGAIGVELAIVETDMGTVIIKRPHAATFRKYQDRESTKTEDLMRLVSPSLVYPDSARFDAILDKLPATLFRCANAVATLAGVRVEELGKK